MKTLGLLFLLLVSLNIKAAVHMVVNTNATGVGSLSSAISSAVDGDIVRMDNSLLANGSDTIHLTSSLSINKGITVEGLYNATDTIYVSGSNMFTIFYVGYLGTVTFKNLALIEGNGGSSAAGAINASYSYGMTIDIYNCVIRNNTTQYPFAGSAVYVSSTSGSSRVTLNIYDSEISNNSGSYAPICTSGRSRSEVYLINSTVYNNSGSKAGAIYALCSSSYYQPKARVYLVNSTIVYNSSTSTAAIEGFASTSNYQDNSSSLIDVKNSTIVYNTGGSGYGALNSHASSYLTSDNRINIKGSVLTLNPGVANYGTETYYVDNLGYNILSATTNSLNLSSLQNNGGETKTMMPIPPSIAIDAGDAIDATNAQNGTIVGIRDIGAAEYIVSCVSNSSSFNDSICQGSSYAFNGQNLTSGGLYYDTLINAGGCDSIVTLNLTVKPLVTPSISISANGPTEVCQGENISFTSSIINGGNSPSYQWKRNGNNVGSGISTYSPNINSNINGDVITCILTSNAICVSNQKDTSNLITLTINPLPTVVINQNGTDLEATPGYVNYEWSYNGNVINNANSNVYTPTQNGQYSLVVTDANGCENTDNFSFNTVDVNSLDLENAISVYPNPTSGDVYIKSAITIKEVSVFDYSGAQKMSYNSIQKISLSELSKGTYIIKLIDEANNQYFKKVVLVN